MNFVNVTHKGNARIENLSGIIKITSQFVHSDSFFIAFCSIKLAACAEFREV